MHSRTLALPLAAALLLGPARAGEAAGGTRIAILPPVIHAVEGHEYLRAGLADMLASRIGVAPGVAVVRVDDPAKATTDPAGARATAQGLGADFVVFGSFTRFGEGASLDVQCAAVKAEGRTGRRVFVQSGTLGEIIPELDGMAEKITRFARSGGVEELPEVAATPSGAAFNGSDPKAEDALAELEALRRRVEEIERVLFDSDGDDVTDLEVRRDRREEQAAPDPDTLR